VRNTRESLASWGPAESQPREHVGHVARLVTVKTPELIAEPASVARVRTVRRIRPSRGLVPVDLRELWAYRSLLYLFMWRDVKTRYRQTFLSGFWAIFRPFSSMVLFSVIFGGLAGIKSGSDVPYPLFVYAGLVSWTYFSSAAGGGAMALLTNGGLLSKAYFPRLYAPLAVVTAPLVDLALSLVIMFGLFGWYHRVPSWHVVFLPFFVLLSLLLALGTSLWLSGATVRYRDVGFAVPFGLQILMYATPVIYPASLVPDRYRWLLSLNPITAIVEGVRWSFFGTGFPPPSALAGGIGVTLVLVGTGVFFFRRTERTIVDMF
jgi:lipopolysaccharide transport system permease protein